MHSRGRFRLAVATILLLGLVVAGIALAATRSVAGGPLRGLLEGDQIGVANSAAHTAAIWHYQDWPLCVEGGEPAEIEDVRIRAVGSVTLRNAFVAPRQPTPPKGDDGTGPAPWAGVPASEATVDQACESGRRAILTVELERHGKASSAMDGLWVTYTSGGDRHELFYDLRIALCTPEPTTELSEWLREECATRGDPAPDAHG